MMNETLAQAINGTEEKINLLHNIGYSLLDSYYNEQASIRQGIEDKSAIGKTGPVPRKDSRNTGRIYFYWAKFHKNVTTEKIKEGKGSSTHQTLYKKGGARSFEYNMKDFKNEPLDWEMELIQKYEPKFAIIREALFHAHDELKKLNKRVSIYEKAFNLLPLTE